MTQKLRLAILGAGGLGKGMAARAAKSPDFMTVAMVDRDAYWFDAEGLPTEEATRLQAVKDHAHSIPSPQPILDLFATRGDEIDVVFVALPNMPVDFIPKTIEMIALQTNFQGVFVDALKRTRAVEAMLELDETLRNRRILYITGAGATPGFLSTLAAVAAQSFVSVDKVDIHFGVGVANWQAYRATIREDFLHLDGFDAERVAQMTDADIEAELDKRNGLLELVNMEHADDIILERAGICRRDQVTVGGLVDTRNAKKPVSTTVSITGVTTLGEMGTHKITLDDATTMVDNVCGPALGFLRQGVRQHRNRVSGVITSADLMPCGPTIQTQAPLVTA